MYPKILGEKGRIKKCSLKCNNRQLPWGAARLSAWWQQQINHASISLCTALHSLNPQHSLKNQSEYPNYIKRPLFLIPVPIRDFVSGWKCAVVGEMSNALLSHGCQKFMEARKVYLGAGGGGQGWITTDFATVHTLLILLIHPRCKMWCFSRISAKTLK